jgi:putative FmdB family regulatory protein
LPLEVFVITIPKGGLHRISKENPMPTYVYLCDKCGEEFNRIMSIKEYGEAKATCPKCKSPQVTQQLVEFIAKTSRKS